MNVRTRPVDYLHAGSELRGWLAWDEDWTTPRPGVLVAHDGIKSRAGFEKTRAEELARLGFAGFVLDVYGSEVFGSSPDDARILMRPFQDDRAFLLARLQAGLETARSQPEIDGERLAAIGYCFGGLCVLDLARAGASLRGVASFHGLLGAPPSTTCAPGPRPIEARVLALHGWDDPFVPPEQVAAFADEMSRAEADWQLIAFGRARHAFTNPTARMPEQGILYDEAANRRSWRALEGFLAELFPPA
jgi:dienelactone hydrolase